MLKWLVVISWTLALSVVGDVQLPRYSYTTSVNNIPPEMPPPPVSFPLTPTFSAVQHYPPRTYRLPPKRPLSLSRYPSEFQAPDEYQNPQINQNYNANINPQQINYGGSVPLRQPQRPIQQYNQNQNGYLGHQQPHSIKWAEVTVRRPLSNQNYGQQGTNQPGESYQTASHVCEGWEGDQACNNKGGQDTQKELVEEEIRVSEPILKPVTIKEEIVGTIHHLPPQNYGQAQNNRNSYFNSELSSTPTQHGYAHSHTNFPTEEYSVEDIDIDAIPAIPGSEPDYEVIQEDTYVSQPILKDIPVGPTYVHPIPSSQVPPEVYSSGQQTYGYPESGWVDDTPIPQAHVGYTPPKSSAQPVPPQRYSNRDWVHYSQVNKAAPETEIIEQTVEISPPLFRSIPVKQEIQTIPIPYPSTPQTVTNQNLYHAAQRVPEQANRYSVTGWNTRPANGVKLTSKLPTLFRGDVTRHFRQKGIKTSESQNGEAGLKVSSKGRCQWTGNIRWTYHEECGIPQTRWNMTYPSCGGIQQSPISITSGLSRVIKVDPLIFGLGYGRKNQIFKYVNSGHGLVINVLHNEEATLSGGGLPYLYRLVKIVFTSHSLHMVDNNRYPLEVHLYHIRNGFTVDQALQQPNAMVVLSIRVTASHPLMSAKEIFESGIIMPAIPPETKALISTLDTLISAAKEVPRPYESIIRNDVVRLGDFVTGDTEGYFAYAGSLPHPPCTEGIIWVLQKKVRAIPDQIIDSMTNTLHSMLSVLNRPVSSNYRETQPTHGRIVEHWVW